MTFSPTDVVARFWKNAETHEELEGPVAVVPQEHLGRRRFLQLLGSAIAVPSLAACTRQPKEEIVPYVKQPEQLVPGRPLFYASAVPFGGVGRAVLVEQHMGRPTKVEGNPDHPASRGGTDTFAQAEILQLYDPDRSQTIRKDGEISSFGELAGAMQAAVLACRAKRGAGLHIVSGETTSPTLIAQIEELLAAMPEARWYVHEPVGNEAEQVATAASFGAIVEARYRFERADVVLSLDADYLGLEGNPAYVRDWADKRTAGTRGGTMNRCYAVQSAPQLTSASADHRAIVRAGEVEHVARLVVAKLLDKLGKGDKAIAEGAKLPAGASDAFVEAVAADLAHAGKNGLVVPGKFQPAIVHRLAHAANHALGAVDNTVWYGAPVRASARSAARTRAELVRALEAGQVDLLVVLGANPAYDAAGFAQAVFKAKLRIHHGLYFDETAALCHWHVPAAHPFESWSDVVSHDGTTSIVQPLIEPLYQSKSPHEVVAALGDKPDRTSLQIVRAHHAAALGDEPDLAWRRVLHDGFFRSGPEPVKTALQGAAWPAAAAIEGDLDLLFRPDPGVYDGRYANNAWLQEMPKPLTQLTWDNAAFVSPATAKALGLENGDLVEIHRAGGSLVIAAWIVPGYPERSVTVNLGYGRTRGGKVLKGSGFNGYALRAADDEWHVSGVTLKKTGAKYDLATAQPHGSMEGRDLAKSATLAAYREEPHRFGEHEDKPAETNLYPRKKYDGYAWGMTIDLTSCIGCSACLVACQAENNVPVVGKAEVMMGREMHWIRIDRYFEGSDAEPDTRFQPVPCMHCENAPCEAVCPVQATVHHDEGLNDMVYNRCIGTKDCSANCAYKVRRFNFFGYGVEAIAPLDPAAASMRMLHNPDVTVRSYGVMEKCSYCVQRINYARVDAKMHQRSIRDGDVMTACQAACPARAITFGNINDPKSQVARRKAEPRNYVLLQELNTLPRTSYLARLTNPNPKLSSG